MKNDLFFGVRVSREEMRAIDLIARKTERRRGDAVRFAIRKTARELAAPAKNAHDTAQLAGGGNATAG
jgi:hypothetical protein